MKTRERQLKEARHRAHVAFDTLWRDCAGGPNWRRRDGAYRWLADLFGMPRRECHLRFFDVGMCEAVIELVAGVKAGIIQGPRATRGMRRIRFSDRMRMRVRRLQRQ